MHAALLLILLAAAPPEDFPDSIVRWKPAQADPVFKGEGGRAWDRKIRERGWVEFADGKYHLWYTGYNDDRSKLRLLGHATSADGLSWERDRANPVFGGSWVEDVCLAGHDGTYYLFAEGKDDVAHLLASTDRVHWEDRGSLDIRKADGEPIGPGPYGTPTAFFEDGVWNLFYERGDQGVWLARSRDMKVWTNVQDDPVLAKGPDAYDREAIAVNQVVKRDGVYYAFYHANAHRNPGRTGPPAWRGRKT